MQILINNMDHNKFKFTTDFQYDLLRYTLIDGNGYKALEMYDDTYFTLTEHAIIAYTIKKYYKRKRVVPGRTIFLQELIKVMDSKNFSGNLTKADKEFILELAKGLYNGIVQDGNEILESVEKFSQYVDLKDVIENVDLLDYNQYDIFSRKVQKAISPRIQSIEERGSFLTKDVVDRQVRRKDVKSVIPLPFRALNELTNAGGYAKGSIFVILDKAKKFKTGMLVNIAKSCWKMGDNVLVVDLDNGEDEFMIRVEQSITRLTKTAVLDGSMDDFIHKTLTKRKNEIIVKKFPALVTTANDIKSFIQYLYREYGIKINKLVIDYISKMGCISGKDSLFERISEAYIDIGNLALSEEIEHVWTAQHVTREAAKNRMATRYDSTDIAGSIDISRHVQAIYGLNRSAEEELEGYQRMEIVDQRDGVPRGRAVFKIDIPKQLAIPLKGDELEKYKESYRDHLERVDKEEASDEVKPKAKRAKTYSNSIPKDDLTDDV